MSSANGSYGENLRRALDNEIDVYVIEEETGYLDHIVTPVGESPGEAEVAEKMAPWAGVDVVGPRILTYEELAERLEEHESINL